MGMGRFGMGGMGAMGGAGVGAMNPMATAGNMGGNMGMGGGMRLGMGPIGMTGTGMGGMVAAGGGGMGTAAGMGAGAGARMGLGLGMGMRQNMGMMGGVGRGRPGMNQGPCARHEPRTARVPSICAVTVVVRLSRLDGLLYCRALFHVYYQVTICIEYYSVLVRLSVLFVFGIAKSD